VPHGVLGCGREMAIFKSERLALILGRYLLENILDGKNMEK
jgi:hypothetical protein